MNRAKIILSIAFLWLSVFLFSQTINDAGEAFNSGGTYFKAKNFTSAITEYKKCIEICKNLGSDGDELLSKAQSSLTLSFLNLGTSYYKNKKFDNAIQAFNEAYNNASDSENKSAAKQYLSRVYNSKGTEFYSSKNYSEAIAAFDKSLEYDNKYIKAVYGKALVYRKQENINAFKTTVDKIIGMEPETDETVKKTKSIASGFFTAEGGKALQGGNFQNAIQMLNIGFEYENDDAQAYYFAAIAYNGLSRWDKAIEAANKAVQLEKKSKSNIYFELAKAYEGAGDLSQACKAYKNVLDGPNADAAKHKVTVELKCN